MKNWLFVFLFGFLLGQLSLATKGIAGEEVHISGVVKDPAGSPIPNAVISFGASHFRSGEVFTDYEGSFIASLQIPQSGDLLLEIYWNDELMFRKPLASLPVAFVDDSPSSPIDTKNHLLFALQNGGVIRLQPIFLGKPTHK